MIRPVRLLIVVTLACIALMLLRDLLSIDPSRRGLEFAPDMVRSPAFDAQEVCDILGAKGIGRPLVDGVVTRDGEDFDYARTPEDLSRADHELASPFTGAPAEPEDAMLYTRFCTPCHDAEGGGRGSVVTRGMLPPPSLAGARARALGDGSLYHIITLGQNNMAAHGSQIQPMDRWRIIRHVRVLQGVMK